MSTRNTHIGNAIHATAVSAVVMAMMVLEPCIALADKKSGGRYMTGVGFKENNGSIQTASGKTGGALTSGLVGILESVTNKFLLPVAVMVCIWRSAYIALFCVVAHTDPLHVINEKNMTQVATHGSDMKSRMARRRQRSFEQGSVAYGDLESVDAEIAKQALMDEVRKSARSLLVVLGFWVFLNAILKVVQYVFGVFGM